MSRSTWRRVWSSSWGKSSIVKIETFWSPVKYSATSPTWEARSGWESDRPCNLPRILWHGDENSEKSSKVSMVGWIDCNRLYDQDGNGKDERRWSLIFFKVMKIIVPPSSGRSTWAWKIGFNFTNSYLLNHLQMTWLDSTRQVEINTIMCNWQGIVHCVKSTCHQSNASDSNEGKIILHYLKLKIILGKVFSTHLVH